MLTNRFEEVLLWNLFHNKEYTQRVFPFLKSEYFFEKHEKFVFDKIHEYVTKYSTNPELEAILITCDSDKSISDTYYTQVVELLAKIKQTSEEKPQNLDWLIDKTEDFCKEKALTKAILESHEISQDVNQNKGKISEILKEALSVSFDAHIGHSYIQESEDRFDSYNKVENKISCDLELVNKITNGGVKPGTLNVVMAGTGGGKSLFLCHLASCYLLQNLNVLYITLEMSENEIAQRIDANTLGIDIKEIPRMSKKDYLDKIRNIHARHAGKLIIKEYPTGTASCLHFRNLLQELKLKKDFSPDVLIIDYISIAASSRFKLGSSVGMYTYIKAIAEECRGLSQELKIPLWTAAQLNRDGFKTNDPGMENTSESFGLPYTADLMIALISTEELEAMKQITIKQLKNRYNDISYYRRFNVGIDKSKMRFYNLDMDSGLSGPENNTQIIKRPNEKKSLKNKFANIQIYDNMLTNDDDEMF